MELTQDVAHELAEEDVLGRPSSLAAVKDNDSRRVEFCLTHLEVLSRSGKEGKDAGGALRRERVEPESFELDADEVKLLRGGRNQHFYNQDRPLLCLFVDAINGDDWRRVISHRSAPTPAQTRRELTTNEGAENLSDYVEGHFFSGEASKEPERDGEAR